MSEFDGHHEGGANERFRRLPRRAGERGSQHTPTLDRFPAVRAELENLARACREIVDLGEDAFSNADSQLSYLAAESVIIHFDDLVTHRLPGSIKARHAELPWRAISHTRNILAHNYLTAQRGIIWQAISVDLPAAIEQLLAGRPPNS